MRSQGISSGLQLMFTPAALAPFVVGSLALSVLGNGVYGLLTNWVGTSSVRIGGIIVGALLILLGSATALSHIVNRQRRSAALIGKTAPSKHKGLILLVSNEPTCRKALNFHAPALRYSWLLHSTQSAAVAEKLKVEQQQRGFEAVAMGVNDVYDSNEFQEKINHIYSHLPSDCEESDVVLDFTGLTACASVGSVLACLGHDRPLQYTPAHYSEELKAIQPLDPVEVVLHWHESGDDVPVVDTKAEMV